MIGIVTIAVRETITKAMLTMKPNEIAASSSASAIRCSPAADVMIG